MAYIGLRPVTQVLSTSTQRFNGDGTTLEFTLQQSVSKGADIIVAVGNALQVPTTDYTASGTSLIFNAGKAPTAGTNNVSVTYISSSLQTVFVTANAYPTGNSVSPAIYSVSSPATGIFWPSTTSLGFSASGNTRVVVSDVNQGNATSTSTGALRVAGGFGVTGTSYIGGGLTVAGAFNTTATTSLTVNTPFVFLANTNVGDAIDQGFVGTYNDGTQRYTGLYRAQSDGRFRLFTNLDNQPTTLVDSGNVSFRYADLWLGNANVTSGISSTSSLTGALTVNGGVGVRGTMYVNSQNAAVAIGNGGTSGVGNIGASGATFNTAFIKSTSAQYADVAEKYVADADYEAGTVLHFGGDKEVSLCTVDMCRRVAGVVSTQPAYLMNDAIKGDHTVTLALLGRVPCKVRGPIVKGDMLVSAGDGYARAENLPQIGSVIGKALEDFHGDHGVIEVVVGRV